MRNKYLSTILFFAFFYFFVGLVFTVAQENRVEQLKILHGQRQLKKADSIATKEEYPHSTAFQYWFIKTKYDLGHLNLANQLIDSLSNRFNSSKVSAEFNILAGKIKTEIGELANAKNFFLQTKKELPILTRVNLLNAWGLLEIEQENYTRADSFFHEVVKFAQKKNLNQYQINSAHIHLGESSLENNKLNRAIYYFEKVEKKLNADTIFYPEIYVRLLIQKGRYHLFLNQFEKARENFKRASILIRNHLFSHSQLLLQVEVNQANIEEYMGDFEKSDSLLTALLNNYKNLPLYHPKIVIIYNSIGNISVNTGNFNKALLNYKKAIENVQIDSKIRLFLSISNQLGNTLWDLGKLTDAEKRFTENVTLAEEQIGKQSEQYIVAVASLAVFYDYSGNSETAEPLYLEVLPIIQSIFGKEHEYYTTTAFNLAWLYQLTNRYNLAERYFLEVASIESNLLGTHHPEYLKTLYGLAKFYYRMEQYEKANIFFTQANTLQLELINNYYSGFEENTRLNYLNQAKKNFDEFLSYLLESHQDLNKKVQQINLITKGLALDYYRANIGSAEISKDSVLSFMYNEYQIERKVLSTAYALSEKELKNAGINLNQQKNKVNQLEKKLTRKAKSLKQTIDKFELATVDNIQQKLQVNELTVDLVRFNYYTIDKKTDTIYYHAILIDKKMSSPKFIPLCTEKQLKSLLTLSNQYGAGYTKYPEIGQKLYELIWQPLEPYLKDVKTIHLSPTGLLHKVAFGGLPYKDGHLLDQYELNYYGNLRDFINAKPLEIPKSIALAGGAYFDIDSTDLVKLAKEAEEFAFVRLDTTNLSTSIAAVSRAIANDSTRNAIEFNYLSGTKKEVEQLTTAFQTQNWQTVTYTGEQASEDNIKLLEGDNASGILHLATHGFFFDPYKEQEALSDETLRERIIGAESPLLRSGLVFSGVNHSWKGGKSIAGLEDGVLTAFEIANMELWNTKLVVLSACETGLGDMNSAEGVFGLQRAFKAAGVDKLVISLWKIPDTQTAELMQLFYQNFLSGMPLAKALRTAQLTMSEQYNPFYWAGFILIE